MGMSEYNHGMWPPGIILSGHSRSKRSMGRSFGQGDGIVIERGKWFHLTILVRMTSLTSLSASFLERNGGLGSSLEGARTDVHEAHP